MATYSQENRPFRLETVLGNDALLLDSFTGVEGVSMPFSFKLNLLSTHDSITANDLLRTPALITVKLADGKERSIHGIVNRFTQLDKKEDLTSYQAEVVPWLWFLSLSSNCRIFQSKSVLQIIESVFKDLGFSDFEIRCRRTYAPRDYCVQYRESHLNFISRLLEDEGIFYFFDHSTDKHTLVLADDNTALKHIPTQKTARMASPSEPGHEAVTTLHWEQSVQPGRVTLCDYDYLQPSMNLESSLSSPSGEEVYDYPGKYCTLEDGDRYVRLRLEAYETMQQHVRGESTCRAFQSGHRFDMTDHYRADINQAYALVHVTHVASAGDYRSWDSAPFDYKNEFVAVPHAVPYRPMQRTTKPFVRGSQTAVVVGKAGEEIWVDEHGRVKVQFFWDREGASNESSSCWIRVASTWAGKGWGSVSIPRIGQEVIVDFLEGDPDRPIITGQVYNAEQTPPFGDPATATQTGMKSRSSPGGGPGNSNEIRMDDKAGSELLFIRAEKDEQTDINNDSTKSVGHDEQVQVANDRTRSVGNNESVTIANDKAASVGNDETITVGNNETVTIGNNRTKNVTSNETVAIGGDKNETVGGNESVAIGGNERVRVAGNRTDGVSGNEVVNVAKSRRAFVGMAEQTMVGVSRVAAVGISDVLTVGLDLRIVSGLKASITVGQSSIVLNANGTIEIKGKTVKIEGSDAVAVTGETIDLN